MNKTITLDLTHFSLKLWIKDSFFFKFQSLSTVCCITQGYKQYFCFVICSFHCKTKIATSLPISFVAVLLWKVIFLHKSVILMTFSWTTKRYILHPIYPVIIITDAKDISFQLNIFCRCSCWSTTHQTTQGRPVCSTDVSACVPLLFYSAFSLIVSVCLLARG